MNNFLGKVIFFFHAVFVIFWYGLFLVPESFFPGKITFHFYLTIVVVSSQFVWGLLLMPWTKKYRMVCFFTTITQLLKGQNISDPNNYNHSFNRDLFKKIGIKISHRATTYITFSVLILVTIQYFLQG
ncbi:MAG: hypothetical protein ABID67_01540 [Candidatus Nealsonbacteria bacterium]